MGRRWKLLGVLALLGGCAPEPLFVWERHLGGVWCYRTSPTRAAARCRCRARRIV